MTEPFDDLIEEEESSDELVSDDLSPREVKRIKQAKLVAQLKLMATPDKTSQMTDEDKATYCQLLEHAEKLGCELSLSKFLQCAWPYLDTSEYKHNWHIDVIAEQAERIVDGDCRRIIFNQPPRTGKSLLLTVAFVAWVWIQPFKGPLSGPHVKFMTGSYGQSLSFEHSNLCRKLIMSPWFQRLWGTRFKLADDRNAIGYFENDKGGYRFATSVGAGLTGRGCDIAIIDDPANTQDVGSEAERQSVINWYSQSLSTRLNDPKTGAIVVVMQRQNEQDLTGYLLESEGDRWDHICLRMRYESNPPLDYDPRTEEGELLWEERIPEEAVKELEQTLGSMGSAGQLQQRPATKGGEIIKAKDWQIFPPKGQEEDWLRDGVLCWPPIDFCVASLDTSSSEKESSDPRALTIWGLWYDKTNMPKIICMHAWENQLSFNPLVMRVGNACRKFKVDALLIEAKANGISVAQEIQRVFGNSDWATHQITPKGDKVARAIAVQGLFEEGLIYAPDKDWAQLLIDRCSSFPNGKYRDLVDTTTMALAWLRANGLIKRKDERKTEMFNALPRPGDLGQSAALYDV